ncbi:MAG: cytidine deaminase [Anaerolineales bacterium]|jgi:cytidine deaminase
MSPEERSELVRSACLSRGNAYAPYSQYAVGAALLSELGTLYRGANVENAAYPNGLCAERVALFSAVAAGERKFRGMAVVTRDGGFPCGACRQALAEFGLGLEILIADESEQIRWVGPLSELLPHVFSADSLRDSAGGSPR